MGADRFPDLPRKMRGLLVDHRGFPIPWFVAYVDGQPQFPIADGRKFDIAWEKKRCWVCGGEIGRLKVFVIGPMCAVNRTSSEPPSHLECARFSARNCPFLTKPRMKRVGGENVACGAEAPAGEMIARNPGVALVWTSLNPHRWDDGRGGKLYDIGDPHAVEWYAEGRLATREEVMASITSGLPILEDMCRQDPDSAGAFAELNRRTAAALELVPA
jgi:hypothetical protein